MKISGKKVVRLQEFERQKLQEALEIVEDLLREINEEPIRCTKEDLEDLIYTDRWESEF
jgi:hypothetical protein